MLSLPEAVRNLDKVFTRGPMITAITESLTEYHKFDQFLVFFLPKFSLHIAVETANGFFL